MKFFVHYTIWNKGAHVPWICEGIRTAFPENTIVDFTLENCTDASELNLKTIFENSNTPNYYGSLFGKPHSYRHSQKKYRWANVNDAIDRFMLSDADVFISPQDDMQIQDKDLVRNITNFFKEKSNVGLIGLRDVIVENKYYSSSFSYGSPETHWLTQGDYMPVNYVNHDPVILTKETVRKVGKFDEEYIIHYVDNDYSFRCLEAGLQNYVMGAFIVHEKGECKICGALQPSDVWTQEVSAHDYNIYFNKWKNKYY